MKKERLDNRDDARRLWEEKAARAKALLQEMFMYTSGGFVPPDNQDWAQEFLLEIFQMFQISHKNFDLESFAYELQQFVYTQSFAHEKAFDSWKQAVFGQYGLDEHSNAVKPKVETNIRLINLSSE